MSDGYAFTDFSSYYAEETKNADKKTKLLRILVIVLTVVLVTEALLYAVIFPCLSPVKVSFYGLESLSPNDVIAECGMEMGTGYISFDVDEFKSRLESVSAIESVTVQKKFPDQIIVEAKERDLNSSTSKLMYPVPISMPHSAITSFGLRLSSP